MPADRDFPATLRAFGRDSGLAGFSRWWASELTPLVPRATRTALRRRRMLPVLAFERDQATLWRPVGVEGDFVMQPAATIPLGGDAAASQAAGRSALDALPRTGSAPRVVIALPGRQTLRRLLALPAALEENLKQALGYDLDRHTPFKADELYFDAGVVGRDPARSEISVELAAARRTLVDQALAHAESFGANVVAVVPDTPEAAASSRLNLLPEERRPGAGGWRRWRLALPVALLLAIAAVAIAWPIWNKREQAIAVHRAADEARSQAAVSEGLRNELDRLTADYNFVLERKFGFPPSLQVMDEITKLLPDDTWLTQMELKTASRGKELQRELLLRGESGNAGRLITLFEESKVFSQAAPRSPTTKIQPGPGEIFDLTAQVRALPPPPAVVVADAGAAAQNPTTTAPTPPVGAPAAAPTPPPPVVAPPPPAPAASAPPAQAPTPAAPSGKPPAPAPAPKS